MCILLGLARQIGLGAVCHNAVVAYRLILGLIAEQEQLPGSGMVQCLAMLLGLPLAPRKLSCKAIMEGTAAISWNGRSFSQGSNWASGHVRKVGSWVRFEDAFRIRLGGQPIHLADH